ncbi:MAG: hypothetical protein RBT34_01205 [Anaerolineaceae bacterium]|jgi:hypothetical protein|nr:hypothetical protein [Anaerolineaceae bacterium]
MNQQTFPESDARHHTQKVKAKFEDLIHHLRTDLEKIDDPQAKALFETSAEVLAGLNNAFEHYEEKTEKAWKS